MVRIMNYEFRIMNWRKLVRVLLLLFFSSSFVIHNSELLFGQSVNFPVANLNKIRSADQFSTLQAAITDAATNNPVIIPCGTYTQNSAVTGLASGMTIQAYNKGCVTVNTNITTGALFSIANVNRVALRGLKITNTGTGGGTAVQCNYCQYSDIDVDVSGPFAIALDVDSNAGGSSLYNDFRISATGLQAAGSCVNITIAGGKVVNANRFWNPVCGPNTAGSVIAWNDGGSKETSVFGGDLSTSDTTAGKGVVTVAATRDLNFYGTTIENNNQGWNVNATSEGVRCYGCTIDSNTTDIVSMGNRGWLQGNVGAIIPILSLDKNGNLQVSGLGLNGAAAAANGINGTTGWAGQVSGATVFTVNTGSFALNQPLNMANNKINSANAVGTSAANPATTGFVNMAAGDFIAWRNNANTADISLSKNVSDQIVANGFILPAVSDQAVGRATTDTLTNKSTAAGPLAGLVASGTSTLGSTAIAAGACATTVTTAATGVATTDAIAWAYASFATPSTDGVLILNAWPTAGNVNFARCNPTAVSITPSALTVNWRVTR